MNDLAMIDLHDGNLKRLQVDFEAETAVIEVEYYLDQRDSAERKAARIKFSGVRAVTQIADLARLKHNASRGGNISYWTPAPTGGSTFIYLADGCIAITSDVAVIEPAPDA